MSTGWWGIPGESKATKIHYTLDGRYPKPICGARLGPLMHYQFCAPGFEERYVECRRCRRIGATPPRLKLPRKEAR